MIKRWGGRVLAAGGTGLLLAGLAATLALRHAQATDGVTEYQVVTSHSSPNSITAGPDGNMWFAEGNTLGSGHQIGRITPAGVVSEWALPGTFSQPTAITPGPDGRIWFNEYAAGGNVGHIDIDGTHLTELAIPSG